jgi:asparagine synthase (glutamine-hydrolysing)
MCGIVGVAGTTADLFAGVASLAHRGPDGSGVYVGSSWALGHTRLAINDLSLAGAQPMSSADGHLVMAFNGEVYNYPELRRECEAKGITFRSSMDGEVILHLWAHEGVSCLGRLNGIFAVAVADNRTGEVTLARDLLGVKPLFYSPIGKGLAFASEPQAISALGLPLGSEDLIGLAQFLTFMWIPAPRTAWQRVSSVEPGTALRYAAGRLERVQWARPLVPEPVDANASVLVEEASGLIQEAVRRQLLSDVPVGLMASGGIDSSLLWWSATKSLHRAYTITWKAPGAERLGDDTNAVKRCADLYGTPVRYLPGEGWNRSHLPPSGDLLADPAYELTAGISRAARTDGCPVLLSGQGGDELFGGYRRHHIVRLLDVLPASTRGALNAAGLIATVFQRPLAAEYLSRIALSLREPDPFRRYMILCSYSTVADRARALGCGEAEVADDIMWSQHAELWTQLPSHLSMLRRAMALDLRVYMPGLGLAYADRAGMEHGVEIRVPLLDLEVVRWSLRLPDAMLLRRGRQKWLARKVAARQLPLDLVNRPKRGFSAPRSQLHQTPGVAGSRRYRQGDYFGRAKQLLAIHRGENRGAEPQP